MLVDQMKIKNFVEREKAVLFFEMTYLNLKVILCSRIKIGYLKM